MAGSGKTRLALKLAEQAAQAFLAGSAQVTAAGQIVFSSWRAGPTEIYVMDASGANATRLTQSAAGTANQSPDCR